MLIARSSSSITAAAGHFCILAAALAPFATAGCATTLVSEPVERRGDGWTVTLKRLTDGPNSVSPSGNTTYTPQRGMRFLHATFKIQNDGPQPRLYSYDACDLDLEGERVLPSMITRTMGLYSAMPTTESYDPGESSWRMLTFSYPKGRFPTRIKCAYVTFELVQLPPAK